MVRIMNKLADDEDDGPVWTEPENKQGPQMAVSDVSASIGSVHKACQHSRQCGSLQISWSQNSFILFHLIYLN